ncbi:MAG: hypothetical protein TQ37_07780 [Candidatus Synechococcus spongiarum 15L]|uniref:TIGR04255 family protein n=1 Tax=Candidatus Synechococcus spongiarum 15L TaxID=1608419 RepID=A0A0G8ATH5_9SYNE|nr:MAG: hypothetical protein TQ37_07780 [Candidatus Synechococcus spongiarum 15L]MCY4388640.1 TIGR04255 family protein [Desulfurellaceae bacterium]
MTTKKAAMQTKEITYFRFPPVDRKVFDRNYLDTVAIELRYPTYLRLKEKEPLEISEAIRERFPLYDASRQMEMTPLGATTPEPVYKFSTKQKDPILDISASNIVLVTKKYKSFEDFSAHVKFFLERCMSYLDTTFFTRVGLRYINHISGIHETGNDILEWINNDLVKPVAGGEIGSVHSVKSELAGPLREGGRYTFRYGLSPSSQKTRQFVLDWDYYKEDVEVKDCMDLLKTFHKAHFPFFWWALGGKAREALKNGTIR